MNKQYALGMDIGGSHLAMAIVDIKSKMIISNTKMVIPINSKDLAIPILNTIVSAINQLLSKFQKPVFGLGISIPGPFDYYHGICKIYNCNKYESLFGIDIRTYLWEQLQDNIKSPSDIVFTNDASCFLLGEAWINSINNENVIAITLGTGIGSGFMSNGKTLEKGNNIPPNGDVYNLPYKMKRAEDWFGTQWFLDTFKEYFDEDIQNVKLLAEKTLTTEKVKDIFQEFGANLGEFLGPISATFKTKYLILGGNISKSFPLFKDTFLNKFKENIPHILIANNTEESAILGAVQKLLINTKSRKNTETIQNALPIFSKQNKQEGFDIFPDFPISHGKINRGYKELAQEISIYKTIRIDGYQGLDWTDFISNLGKELNAINASHIFFSMSSSLKPPEEINEIVSPYLGGDDPLFGKLFKGLLQDFYNLEKLDLFQQVSGFINILYGPGSSLSQWKGKLIYVDIPKDQIQHSSRVGNVLNLGMDTPLSPKPQYKRMFFVDWPVLNKHKANIINDIDYIVDGQFLDNISWADGVTFKKGLLELSQNAFRAKPWFSPGVWGGDWMKKNFRKLEQNVLNYAWSFELIVPENGVVFSDNGIRLEVSFDFLMYYDNKAILGNAANTFGTDFPIRFNYLDTFNGDKLSLQCHPSSEFIREHFSEKFTQDETYYIFDAGSNAEVYLGFKEDVKKEEFYRALIESDKNGTPIIVEDYIQNHRSKKHELFLIPNGTIHCSGINNLVLEISSTPYIYTFKMYDWMRLDMDGKPRPLNIERGIENVNFDCQGSSVIENYISNQSILKSGNDWQTVKLSTHPKHFYEIHRFEFDSNMEISTNGQCHILNLVEGTKISVITGDRELVINYGETFVIPSATDNYTLVNKGGQRAKVIQANVKPSFCDTKF
jgi:predicted NBD/HSP70 family sugar kinase/mannose-6-phosphate isomerase class I